MPEVDLSSAVGSASASYGPGYEPAEAFDGSTATYWSAPDAAQHWMMVDIGALVPVNRITTLQGVADDTYSLWVGDTLTSLERVASAVMSNNVVDEWVFHPRLIRYIVWMHDAGNDWANLKDIEVWFDPAPFVVSGATEIQRLLPASDFGSYGTFSASTTLAGTAAENPFRLDNYLSSGNGYRWLSDAIAGSSWLKADLGSPQTVGRVRLFTGNNSNVNFIVEHSNDDSVWTLFGEDVGGQDIVIEAAEVDAQYWRISGENVIGTDTMGLSGVFFERDVAVPLYGGGGGGEITLVGLTQLDQHDGLDMTITVPEGAQAGDLLILTSMANVSNASAPRPSSSEWNLLCEGKHSLTGTKAEWNTNSWCWYEDLVDTVIPSGTDGNRNAVLTVWRGVDPNSPFGEVDDVWLTGTAGLHEFQEITTLVENELVVFTLALGENGMVFSTFTNANLSDLTNHSYVDTGSNFPGDLFIGSGLKASAGATGVTNLQTVGATWSVAFTFSLIPAAVAGGSGSGAGLTLLGVA